MKVLILAGGYGTRLYPLVKDIPKALLDINGKSLIDFVLDKVAKIPDVEEVVVVTNDKFHHQLEEWANKQEFSSPIRVVNDQTKTPNDRLGAVGDMQYVIGKDNTVDWLVLGSDNLFDYEIVSFIDFAQQKGDQVSIGLYDVGETTDASKYGVVAIDDNAQVVGFEEKPKQPRSSLITMCMFYFPKGSLPLIPQFLEETGSRDAAGGYIQWLYPKTKVYGFKFTGKWYDIGSIESYQEAQKEF